MRAADWSMGGLRIEGFPDPVPEIGRTVDLQLTLPFQGFDVTFDAVGEVVRNKAEIGMFAVRFTEIGERERELMSHFLEELVRGSMTPIEETINRIDVPVTPASLKPDASPVSEVPVHRWPIKTIAMTALYGVLGICVFAYLAVLVYSNFYRLEVQTAVIAAPIAPVKATVEGRIARFDAHECQMVRQGEIIARIENPRLEREITTAELAVQQQQAKLAYLKRRHLDELKRAESFATLELSNVQTTKLQLEGLQAELEQARRKLARLSGLYARGYATASVREEAEKEVIRLDKLVKAKAVDLRSRAQLADKHLGERFYTGMNVVGDLGDISAQVKLAENEIEISRERHARLLQEREKVALEAPM